MFGKFVCHIAHGVHEEGSIAGGQSSDNGVEISEAEELDKKI
jgi:hypothetical protein